MCGCGYEFVISSIQVWAYELQLYVYGWKLVCEVVNYYHDLQLFVLLLFIYCFYVLMSSLLNDWVLNELYFRFGFP